MRVAYVIPMYEPVWANGVVTSTSALCRQLARKGQYP